MLYDKEKWEDIGFKNLAKKRAISYLIPYFILSGINLILNGIYEIPKCKNFDEWMNMQVYHTGWIIYSNGNGKELPYCSPLWFLTCLFLACLIVFFVLRLNKFKQILICVFMFVLNRFFEQSLTRCLPWRMDVALVGAIFMVIGYYIKKLNFVVVAKKYGIWIGLLVCGLFIDCFFAGEVSLMGNTMETPLLTFICSIFITISIVVFSDKICHTHIGAFLGFCGKSTIVFMGFNYYLKRLFSEVWKQVPILNGFEYSNGTVKFLTVTLALVLLCYLWENVKIYIQKDKILELRLK